MVRARQSIHSLGLDKEEVNGGEDDNLHPNIDQVVSPGNGVESDRIHPLILNKSQP
jgi:hypothetical protein